MATVGSDCLTLADWAKRVDPDGGVPVIAEILNQTNEILDDMLFIEGNLPTGHRGTIRTGIPDPTWRQLYKGVQPTKSTTRQVDDACGMLEAYGEVDKDLADLNGNTNAFRFTEDSAHIEGMSQGFVKALFYGNSDTNPEKIMGFAPRYNSLSAGNGSNIIDAGGTGSDNTSIWLIVWGQRLVTGIFPKGSKAGLQNKDLGEQTLFDSDGGRFQGYRSHYQWKPGLHLADWRYAVRIANIDVSNLATAGDSSDTSANIIKHLIVAYNKVPKINAGRAAIYANADVKTALDIKAMEKGNLQLTVSDLNNGVSLTKFKGIPIRKVDALLNTEARVV